MKRGLWKLKKVKDYEMITLSYGDLAIIDFEFKDIDSLLELLKNFKNERNSRISE